MSQGATADFDQISAILGVIRISGWAEGTVLSISYNAKQFTTSTGVDGLGLYIKNRNLSATITATVKQNSIANDLLSAAFQADFNAPGGLVLPLMIKENNGRTVYAAESARIDSLPDAGWGDGADNRTWTIITTKLIGFLGGLGKTPEGSQQ